jgi:hypothetical protein
MILLRANQRSLIWLDIILLSRMLSRMVFKLALCIRISWRHLIGSGNVFFWTKCWRTLGLLVVYGWDHIYLEGCSALADYVSRDILVTSCLHMATIWDLFTLFGLWMSLQVQRFSGCFKNQIDLDKLNALFLNVGKCRGPLYILSRSSICC